MLSKTLQRTGLLGLALCLLLALVQPAPRAQAIPTTPYPVALYAHQAYSHPDGSMTFAECFSQAQAYSSQLLMTVSSDGDTLTSLPKAASSTSWKALTCEDGPVVGYDSTVYAAESRSTGTGYSNYRIAAYKHGVLLWSYSLATCTSYQRDGRPKWLTHGYDDNIYFVMNSSCTSSDVLVGLDSVTGASLFTPIPFTQDMYVYEGWHSPITTYAGGLVMLDNNTLKYYSYAGQSNATSYSVPIISGESFVRVAFGDNGRATIAVSKPSTGCSGVHRVEYHDPGGTSGSFPTVTQCPSIGHLRALPDGSILLKHGALNGYDAIAILADSPTV